MLGVLALQGAFARHVEVLHGCGVDAIEVRTPEQLDSVDALVIPGGESSTMSKLIDSNGLRGALSERLAAAMPAFGTCAGMILLADEVLDGRADQASFGVIDIAVRRNGYGRQIDSFESDLLIDGIDGGEAVDDFRAVFIRAPIVERVGNGVEVLASVDGTPVVCRSGTTLVSSFHPELTNDDRLHRLFLDHVAG